MAAHQEEIARRPRRPDALRLRLHNSIVCSAERLNISTFFAARFANMMLRLYVYDCIRIVMKRCKANGSWAGLVVEAGCVLFSGEFKFS